MATDNSASAIAQRKKLEAELYEAKEEQEELYYERSIENSQDALDKELEDFKETKEQEMEQLDQYLEDVERIVTESLDIVRSNAEDIGATLTDKTQEYNLTVSDAVLKPWEDGASAIDTYTTKFGDATSSTTSQLATITEAWNGVKTSIASANIEADKYYNKQMATANSPSVAEINKENKDYYSGGSTKNASSGNAGAAQPIAPMITPKSASTHSLAVGNSVKVKTSATHFSANSGNAKMASFVPGGSYTVYEIDGNQVLIGQNGALTGWINKSDLQGYAKGSISVDEDQFAWIDELGEELQLVPGANGRLEYIKKGTGIVPADLTARLMSLAMNPQEMIDRNRPQIAPSKSIVNNEMSIDASVGTLIHVDHLDGNNPDEVIKLVDKAWDKKMQGLNSAIKKFTR